VSTSRGRYLRERYALPLSIAIAVTILVAMFPAQSLWRQQSELSATSAAISRVKQESANLTAQAKSVSSAAAAISLAREQYQLVLPGQRLIQILPGSGTGFITANSGDPGQQPLVNPQSALLNLPTTQATASTPTRASGGFVSRLLRTLEFWH